ADGHKWDRAEFHPELFPPPPSLPSRKPAAPASNVLQPAVMDAEVLAEAVLPLQAEGQAPGEEWYYTHGGVELGPIGATEIKRLIGLGQLVAEDHVWTEG